MSPEIVLLLVQFAVKFGIDAAISIASLFSKPSVSLDDCIAALQLAKTKTAADYLAEASANKPAVVPPTP